MKETDAIFENVREARERAASDSTCLRLSLDTKAKVKIGPFSRGGRSRHRVRACDHDMHPEALLVPLGILELTRGGESIQQLNILFGQSRETSDFIVDGLEQWWTRRSTAHPGVRKLQISLDNGPEISSARTQFLKRLVAFSDRHHLQIELVYYPPYHSKYNPVERCWGILEEHWNGALLESIPTALNWAKTMTWHRVQPLVDLVTHTYDKGVRLTRSAFRPIANRLKRHSTLPKWSLTIHPA